MMCSLTASHGVIFAVGMANRSAPAKASARAFGELDVVADQHADAQSMDLNDARWRGAGGEARSVESTEEVDLSVCRTDRSGAVDGNGRIPRDVVGLLPQGDPDNQADADLLCDGRCRVDERGRSQVVAEVPDVVAGEGKFRSDEEGRAAGRGGGRRPPQTRQIPSR